MPTSIILTVILAVVVCLLFLTFIARYKRCPSNKILVIYGKTGGGTAAKCIHGGAAFVLPLLQDYEYLDLEPFVVPIDLDNALSQENIRVSVPMSNLGQRLMGALPPMHDIARMAGLELPEFLGKMTGETAFVPENAKPEADTTQAPDQESNS